MYYCTADEQVAYTNALNAENSMINNGALDVQAINMGNNDHGGCILPALSSAFNWFQNLKTPCNVSSSINRNLISYEVYPNPFTNELNVQFAEKVNLSVYTMDGKLLLNKDDVQNIELVTSNWSKGNLKTGTSLSSVLDFLGINENKEINLENPGTYYADRLFTRLVNGLSNSTLSWWIDNEKNRININNFYR